MTAWRSLAIGSTLGWCTVTASMLPIGMVNVGTLAAAALPIGLWTVALLIENRKTERIGAEKAAPAED